MHVSAGSLVDRIGALVHAPEGALLCSTTYPGLRLLLRVLYQVALDHSTNEVLTATPGYCQAIARLLPG